jgi:Tol biopolymer transport system component
MSLKPGQRLGPYEIESPLGAGGMGEVYRARDTRLDRTVAVKVLPSHLAEHPLGRERFEREARAVSALSHPHICALFDVGEAEGITFIVMEHLEGDSLADRLDKGPLPIEQVPRYGAQIADALDRAHRAGIVHRDLKPGNVMLTKSGAKLLDFGLAKQTLEAERPPESSAPTESKPATEAGTVLGTYQYMAPEQLEGQEADGRADIWALGCLLYEMATGRPAFAGKSQASLISSIMRDTPAPIAERQPLVSAPLDHVVGRCLEKDREERWQSAHDVAEELRWLESPTSRGGAVPAAEATAASGRVRWALAALGVVVAGVFGFVAGRSAVGTSAKGDARATRVARQLTFQKGVEHRPALSPDGKRVAYVSNPAGNDDIFIQRVDGRNALNLTADSPGADTEPAFSPDGNQIAFRSERGGGGLFVMGATGESVRRVSDRGHNPSWSPDGRQLVVSTEGITDPLGRQATAELWTVEVATGETRRLYTGDAVQPTWSPDGRRIAFWKVDGNTGQRDLATIDAEGEDEPEAVTADVPVDWSPVWSPDGATLYFVSDRAGTMDVWQVAIDPETGHVEEEPVRVGAPAEEVAWLTVARASGSLAYVSSSMLHDMYSLPFEPERLRPAGGVRTVYTGALPIREADPSPDGTSIALTTGGTQEDLYTLGSEGGELNQLTNDPFRDRGPQWSPDGSEIAFYSNRSGTYQIWSIRPDGSGLRPLTAVSGGAWYAYWSPDGARIASPTGTETCIITVGNEAVSSAECLPNPSDDSWYGVRDWSPDGRWLIGNPYSRGGTRRPDLLLWSFDAEEYQPVGPVGFVARWLPDSRHLLAIDESARVVLIDRAGGAARPVGPLGDHGPLDPERLALSRDGRTVLMHSRSLEANVWLLSAPMEAR